MPGTWCFNDPDEDRLFSPHFDPDAIWDMSELGCLTIECPMETDQPIYDLVHLVDRIHLPDRIVLRDALPLAGSDLTTMRTEAVERARQCLIIALKERRRDLR